jgi:hypothetical protein
LPVDVIPGEGAARALLCISPHLYCIFRAVPKALFQSDGAVAEKQASVEAFRDILLHSLQTLVQAFGCARQIAAWPSEAPGNWQTHDAPDPALLLKD